ALMGSVTWVLLHSFVDPKLPALALEATGPADSLLASGVLRAPAAGTTPESEETASGRSNVSGDIRPLMTGRASVQGNPAAPGYGLPAKPFIASGDPLELCLECLWQQARHTIDGSV